MQGSSFSAPLVDQDSSVHREGLTYSGRLLFADMLVRPSPEIPISFLPPLLGIVGLLIVSKYAKFLR